MQANLENLGTLERRLSVAVPMVEIDREIDTRLKRLTRTVKMHGFRPGKVPLKVVAQQYGPQVRQEVLGETLQRSFGEAVREQNLKVAGYPQFEPKPLQEGANAFEYSATFEVYPEVRVGDISSASLKREQLGVTDADVDRTLEVMRKQRAKYEPVERGAQNGDRVTMSYTGTIDGTEFPGGAAAMFELQNGLILALYGRADLASDANTTFEAPGSGEFSIGHLVGSRDEVDGVLAEATAAGATLTEEPHDRPWGIYSGYFRDPDGHLWEVIWNPRLDSTST